MDGVTEGMIFGSNTEVSLYNSSDNLLMHDKVVAGEKMIVTAGALDVHVHYICTQLWTEVCRSHGTRAMIDLNRLLHLVSPLWSVVEVDLQMVPTPQPVPRVNST